VGLALPIWLVVFIVLYALATLYVAIKYRKVRKFLAGAFIISSGTYWYLWVTGVSLPIVLPYVGTVSVETPEISVRRHHSFRFILALLLFRFHQQAEAVEMRHFVSHCPTASVAARP
jgi:hypothetical protein